LEAHKFFGNVALSTDPADRCDLSHFSETIAEAVYEAKMYRAVGDLTRQKKEVDRRLSSVERKVDRANERSDKLFTQLGDMGALEKRVDRNADTCVHLTGDFAAFKKKAGPEVIDRVQGRIGSVEASLVEFKDEVQKATKELRSKLAKAERKIDEFKGDMDKVGGCLVTMRKYCNGLYDYVQEKGALPSWAKRFPEEAGEDLRETLDRKKQEKEPEVDPSTIMETEDLEGIDESAWAGYAC
jgi:chromosome segregation ATPase